MAKRTSAPLRASERAEIEKGLNAGDSIRSIAAAIGRCPSTVAREVRANRAPANLARRGRPEDEPEPDCPRLEGSPGVCNACPKLKKGCGHVRWLYRADRAGMLSSRRRSESREGIDMDPEPAARALAAIDDGVARGMSPYEISVTMPGDARVSPGTIYNWIDKGYAGQCNLSLQRKVGFKPRAKKKAPSAPRRPEERSYAAFLALGEEECASAWEMDSLLGWSTDRKRVLTLYCRPAKLQLYLLLTGGSCSAVKAALQSFAGCAPGAFSRAFRGPVLTDNGAEFSDWDGLGGLFGETPGSSPRLFYCDPMRSDQKGGCEKGHTEARRVLAKGLFSFDLLVQADLSLAMSHVNSTPRKSMLGMTPIDAFLAACGDDGRDLLDALGVSKVAPSELLLKPSLIDKGRAERGERPLGL